MPFKSSSIAPGAETPKDSSKTTEKHAALSRAVWCVNLGLVGLVAYAAQGNSVIQASMVGRNAVMGVDTAQTVARYLSCKSQSRAAVAKTNPDGDKLTQGIVPPGSSLGFDSDAAWLFTRDTDVAMGDCLIAGAAQPLDFMNDLLVGGATLGALAAQSRLGDAHPMSAAQTQSAQTQVAFVKSHAETEFARNVAINDEWVRSVAKMCEGPLGKARCATLWLSKESRGTFKHPEAAVDQQEYYAGVAARLDRAAWRLNHPAEHILFLDKLAAASRANQKGADKALPAEPGPSFDELFALRLEQAKAMRAKSMQAASE